MSVQETRAESNLTSALLVQSQQTSNMLSVRLDIALDEVPEAAFSLLTKDSFMKALKLVTRAAFDFEQSEIKDSE